MLTLITYGMGEYMGELLTLVTCMGGVDVDTDHMHGRSGC